METPEEILPHAEKYRNRAWQDYEPWELGMWVHLLLTRSWHRKGVEKQQKDLRDARNYLAMLRAHLDAADDCAAKSDA